MYKSKLIIGVLIMLGHFTSKAQTVILINGEPTKVILEGTEIDTILETQHQVYMKGFDTEVPNKMKKSSLKKVPSARAATGSPRDIHYYITGINFNRTDKKETDIPELELQLEE